MLGKFLNSIKAYADQQEQQEQQALMLAMLAYKHGIADAGEVALLLEAVQAGCHE